MNYTALCICAIAGLVATPQIPAAEIPQGTHVLLRMLNTVSTRTAQQGDQVYLQTTTPVVVNDTIVIPPNSYVQGIVSMSRRGGLGIPRTRAQLGLHIESLTLPSGKTLKITPRLNSTDPTDSGQRVGKEGTVQQGSRAGKDAETIAVTAGTGAIVGGLADRSFSGAGLGAGIGSAVGVATALLRHGPDVELRQGTTLDIVFDRPLDLQ